MAKSPPTEDLDIVGVGMVGVLEDPWQTPGRPLVYHLQDPILQLLLDSGIQVALRAMFWQTGNSGQKVYKRGQELYTGRYPRVGGPLTHLPGTLPHPPLLYHLMLHQVVSHRVRLYRRSGELGPSRSLNQGARPH